MTKYAMLTNMPSPMSPNYRITEFHHHHRNTISISWESQLTDLDKSRSECDEYIPIFKYICHRYLFRHSFVSIFWYKYIRTFVRVKFDCTNIFGYSFMSVLECNNCSIFEYIRIFVQFSIQIFFWTFVRVKFVIRIYSDIRAIFNTYTYSDIRSCQTN